MTDTVYRLPRSFYWDHVQRDLPSGQVMKETKRHVFVDLDAESYDDLLSDAKYYSNTWMFGPELLGLCSSAKATVRALETNP